MMQTKYTAMLVVGASALVPALSNAQTSALYLTSFGSTSGFIVQGGSVSGTWTRDSSTDNALAVTTEILSFERTSGAGNRYDLAGNYLGDLTSTNPGFVDCYDGATDGTRTWSVAHNDFSNNQAVIMGGADWSGAAVSFAPVSRSSGITYDATDDSLWLTNNVGGTDGISHYSTTGTFLGGFSFAFLGGAGYGLALDPADNTLWVAGGFGTAGNLYQYDKAGNLLNTVSVAGLAGENIMGAEFAAVPEPGTLIALGLGALALRRRRKN
ncbi:MAG: PEP-CTERM sorting domain-containing protein [Fimbriimonadaceae bacterium]|nr:PEP-CTERM sorting domain-containing protein [Fimbriimonadaceae bacterium]